MTRRTTASAVYNPFKGLHFFFKKNYTRKKIINSEIKKEIIQLCLSAKNNVSVFDDKQLAIIQIKFADIIKKVETIILSYNVYQQTFSRYFYNKCQKKLIVLALMGLAFHPALRDKELSLSDEAKRNLLSQSIDIHPAITLQIISRFSQDLLFTDGSPPWGILYHLADCCLQAHRYVLKALLKITNLNKKKATEHISGATLGMHCNLAQKVDLLRCLYHEVFEEQELRDALETITGRLYELFCFEVCSKEKISELCQQFELPKLTVNSNYLDLVVRLLASEKEGVLPEGQLESYKQQFPQQFQNALTEQLTFYVLMSNSEAVTRLCNLGARIPSEEWCVGNELSNEYITYFDELRIGEWIKALEF